MNPINTRINIHNTLDWSALFIEHSKNLTLSPLSTALRGPAHELGLGVLQKDFITSHSQNMPVTGFQKPTLSPAFVVSPQ